MALSSATGATTAYNVMAAKDYYGINSSKKHYAVHATSRSLTSLVCFGAVKRSCRIRQLVLRCSADTDDQSATATEEAELETPTEVSKGPPSLISALNVEKALRGIAITDVDHYGRLGLQSRCSYDQVTSAYKNKVTEAMNQGLTEEALSKELNLLEESHSILSSVEERRMYDWSLARKGNPDRYMWPSEVDITQIQFPGTPPPQEPEDEGPTRLVGYFIFSWFILSIVLFIAFNR